MVLSVVVGEEGVANGLDGEVVGVLVEGNNGGRGFALGALVEEDFLEGVWWPKRMGFRLWFHDGGVGSRVEDDSGRGLDVPRADVDWVGQRDEGWVGQALLVDEVEKARESLAMSGGTVGVPMQSRISALLWHRSKMFSSKQARSVTSVEAVSSPESLGGGSFSERRRWAWWAWAGKSMTRASSGVRQISPMRWMISWSLVVVVLELEFEV